MSKPELIGVTFESDLMWQPIEAHRRKMMNTFWGLTRSFTHYAVIDGVTIYRSKTRCMVVREGCSVTASPKKGQTLDECAQVFATSKYHRPPQAAIDSHDKLVAGVAL